MGEGWTDTGWRPPSGRRWQGPAWWSVDLADLLDVDRTCGSVDLLFPLRRPAGGLLAAQLLLRRGTPLCTMVTGVQRTNHAVPFTASPAGLAVCCPSLYCLRLAGAGGQSILMFNGRLFKIQVKPVERYANDSGRIDCRTMT